jgi:hypothetical protein
VVLKVRDINGEIVLVTSDHQETTRNYKDVFKTYIDVLSPYRVHTTFRTTYYHTKYDTDYVPEM